MILLSFWAPAVLLVGLERWIVCEANVEDGRGTRHHQCSAPEPLILTRPAVLQSCTHMRSQNQVLNYA